MLPRVLDAAEVATLLGVNIATVYTWAKTGDLPALRAGRSYRFALSAIVERFGGLTGKGGNSAPGPRKGKTKTRPQRSNSRA
jgi:excisionase family DNA binding protein